jgi:hypothetical protein
VPWFVQWVNATQEPVAPDTPGAVPEFRAMDRHKFVRAIREKRCWTCGDVLGAYLTFVIGPMCGVNRTTAEPASHRECAQWSARNCPFLSRPHMDRRDNDGLMERCAQHVAGEMLARNPGVTLLWTTKTFKVWNDGKGKPLLTIGDPLSVEWWAEGRAATRAEIEESVRTGLPALEALATQQDTDEGGTAAQQDLARRLTALAALYPSAPKGT